MSAVTSARTEPTSILTTERLRGWVAILPHPGDIVLPAAWVRVAAITRALNWTPVHPAATVTGKSSAARRRGTLSSVTTHARQRVSGLDGVRATWWATSTRLSVAVLTHPATCNGKPSRRGRQKIGRKETVGSSPARMEQQVSRAGQILIEVLRVLSASLHASAAGRLVQKTVALRNPVMPVADGLGGRLVRIHRGQLRERNCQVPALPADQYEHVTGARFFGRHPPYLDGLPFPERRNHLGNDAFGLERESQFVFQVVIPYLWPALPVRKRPRWPRRDSSWIRSSRIGSLLGFAMALVG